MTIALFYHSALSDWNHGNAHFLRGVAVELQARGHRVTIYEPSDSWSATNLVADHGHAALMATLEAYPSLRVVRYPPSFEPEEVLDEADLVLVHEWNTAGVVKRIGDHRLRSFGVRYVLLFHDTHHRSVSEPDGIAQYDLSGYDGVLAFGEPIRERYLAHGWTARAFTWHEAADVRTFSPRVPARRADGDLVWVGNWGDEERTAELREFLLDPARAAGCRTTVHGVRYPPTARAMLASAGIDYRGWVPNYRVPEVFASHRVTVHVPRRPYVTLLPGIPTIRPFEALACGLPLVSAPWCDLEGLFTPGEDYLVARNGREMTAHLRAVIADPELAAGLGAHGRRTILARHTCGHRVDELLSIAARLSSRAELASAGHAAALAEEAR